jgi:transglutaminase-like putative cysteine protease
MSFGNLQKSITYLLAGIGLAALTFGGELSLLSIAVIGAAFVASWFVKPALVEHPLWSRGWTVLLAVLLGVQVIRAISGGAGWLGYAMEFAALLTISGVFLAFVVVTPWALTLAHMRFEIERNYPKESDADGGSNVTRVLSSRRLVGPKFLLWTALLSLPMLAMTVSLFLLFPRVGLGFVSLGQQRGQHVAGFGNKVELGGFGVIRDDPTVVVRVTPSRPLSFDEQQRYLRLRGTAFDNYDGRKWTRSEGDSRRMSPIGDYYTLRRMGRDEDLGLQVILDRLDEPVLFVAPGSVGFRIPQRGVMGSVRDSTRITRSHGLDLRYQSSDELGIVYELIVSTDAEDLDVPVTRDMDDDRYLQMPTGHERVAALAKKLTEGLTDPLAISERLQSHLRDQDRYEYTVEQPNVGSKVPLDVFLFEARRGHCEYFATALAVMLRSLGIPSRNVTGFVGGEYNRYGHYFAIKQADAHSWVEAYIPERGWITLDPTPASRNDLGPTEWLLRDVGEMMDAMRAYWMMRVVGYDLRTQVRGLRDISRFLRSFQMPSFGLGKQGEGPTRSAGNDQTKLQGSLLVGLFCVVLLIGGAIFALRSLRRRADARLLSVSAREARELYRDLEKVLAQKGKGRPPHVTPEAHAAALRATGFAHAEAVSELTEVYLKSRYGAVDMPRERARAMKERLRDIKRAA